jgi:hypothetical protein
MPQENVEPLNSPNLGDVIVEQVNGGLSKEP